MQLYNRLFKVTVESLHHGGRSFLVTARSSVEALNELDALILPWLDDEDLTVMIKKDDEITFVVITDRAFTAQQESN